MSQLTLAKKIDYGISKQITQKRDCKVVAKAVAYLLDQSRWKSYHRINS